MDKNNNVDFKETEMHLKCRLQKSGGHFVPTLKFQTHWPEQTGRHFTYTIFKYIFLDANCCISFIFHWIYYQGHQGAQRKIDPR